MDFQSGRLPKGQPVPPKQPSARDLLAEAAEHRRCGDLAAAAAAEIDAIRAARAVAQVAPQ